MARSVSEIQASIKDDFIANNILVSIYNLDFSKSFDDQFSKMSVESNLIYVFALAIYAFERILDIFKSDIQAIVDSNALLSIPWYYSKCKEFQLGDIVVYSDATYRFAYDVVDESKQIVKFVAIREVQEEGVSKLKIYISKANKEPLNANEMTAFKSYITRIGGAGMHYDFISIAATKLSFNIQVVYNAMLLDQSGTSLNDGSKPIELAISSYLDNILYGGVFNRTSLVDAIQKAPGVIDVILSDVRIGEGAGELDNSQNISAPGGAFTFNLSNSTINYVANVY